MAKIHRFSGYAVDPTGFYDTQDMKIIVGKYLLDEAYVEQFHTDTSDDFDWNDDLPEAQHNCDLAHLEKHFNRPDEEVDATQVKVGGMYRHFKEGKIVKVIAISRHTETQELTVVYECSNGIWNRPLSMFLSPVDSEKYPEHAGEMRFTLVGNENKTLDTTFPRGLKGE